jgi:hypothetical protein
MSEATATTARPQQHRKPPRGHRARLSTDYETGSKNAANARNLFDIAGPCGELSRIKPAAPLLACVIRRVFFCPDGSASASERRFA